MMQLAFRTKLVLTTIIPLLVIGGFTAAYFPTQQSRAAETALATHANSIAATLAPLITTTVSLMEEMPTAREDLTKQLQVLGNDVDYALVSSPTGSVVAQHHIEYMGTRVIEQPTTPQTVVAGGDLHVLYPLVDDGKPIGTLSIGFSRDKIVAAEADARTTALTVLAVVVLLGFGVAWLVSRTLTRPIMTAAGELTTLSHALVSAAREQEASAAQSATAVEETRRTTDALVAAAQQISDSCSVVLGNAEQSLKGSQQIADRIAMLTIASERVTEISATIMQIADRTDLLALNAALEGTKAGEAGKGFALVAAEMRRLAENVVDSVAGIRSLMKDMKSSSQAAVEASSSGVKLSSETTNSAREIALVTQQQRKATEQVGASMDEMTSLISHNVTNIQRTARSAATLAEVAERLSAAVQAARTQQTQAQLHRNA